MGISPGKRPVKPLLSSLVIKELLFRGNVVMFGQVFAPITAVVRLLSVIVSRHPSYPYKSLQARLITRGIVAELPPFVPFYISDEAGTRYKGVYAIGMLVWNRGNQPIIHSDFLEAAPLLVKVGEDATIVAGRAIAIEDQTFCSVELIDNHTLSITFDCLNPDDYLVVLIYVTRNPSTNVQITGRIIGQSSPIDHTAEEVRASWGERFSSFIILILILNTLPGPLVGVYLIYKYYGINTLLHDTQSIPIYLMLPIVLGLMTTFMSICAHIVNWFERRKYPKGYPLRSDLEPPLLENIKGLFLTIFKGKKQRVNVSLLNWGEPVIMPDKNIRRRTINDWIQ
jgi:hypothetical protein